uniref:NADP-dependent oxidoreductase domain-containing protein n=1 Tax=Triticum aestivum TaxID=4565 RepID=A0A077RRT8_WHEAT|nr:unnamed protein product [Triticum aestivum]
MTPSACVDAWGVSLVSIRGVGPRIIKNPSTAPFLGTGVDVDEEGAFLPTKVGSDAPRVSWSLWPLVASPGRSAKGLGLPWKLALENTLKDLQLDYIDLYHVTMAWRWRRRQEGAGLALLEEERFHSIEVRKVDILDGVTILMSEKVRDEIVLDGNDIELVSHSTTLIN